MPAGAFHNPQNPVFPCPAFSPSPICFVFSEKNMGVPTHLCETSRGPSVHLVLPRLDLLSDPSLLLWIIKHLLLSASRTYQTPADTLQPKLVSHVASPFTPSLPQSSIVWGATELYSSCLGFWLLSGSDTPLWLKPTLLEASCGLQS